MKVDVPVAQKNGHLGFMTIRGWVEQEEILEKGFGEVSQIPGRGRAFLSCVEMVKRAGLLARN